jgi:hypothetical protein
VSEAEGNSRKEALSAPDTAAQKQEIKLLMQEELREGDTRYQRSNGLASVPGSHPACRTNCKKLDESLGQRLPMPYKTN